MNKFLIWIIINLLGIVAFANELQIFVPTTQYRYENDKDQLVLNRKYQNYNLAAVIFNDYLVGVEFNHYKQDSQSGSILITEKFQEFNLYAGYYVFSKLLNNEYKIIFDLGPVAYIGQSRSTVETVIGSSSDLSVGENNMTFSAGGQATLRIAFMLIQPEIRYGYSRASSPNWVPMYGARVGFRIGL